MLIGAAKVLKSGSTKIHKTSNLANFIVHFFGLKVHEKQALVQK
jgi:hypothetical protein